MHPHFLFLDPQRTPSPSFRLRVGDTSSVEASLEVLSIHVALLWPALPLPVHLLATVSWEHLELEWGFVLLPLVV